MTNKFSLLAQAALLVVSTVAGMAAQAANPIVPGWYADPEIRIFDGRYWIYPTYSDAAGKPEQPPSFNARQNGCAHRRS